MQCREGILAWAETEKELSSLSLHEIVFSACSFVLLPPDYGSTDRQLASRAA